MKSIIVWGIAIFTLTAGGVFVFNYEKLVEIPRARSFINDQLKDPESTKFRNDRITKSGWLCGELNSKNGSGGYVGFKRYISSGASGAHYLEDHGNIGKESNADLLAVLDEESKILKGYVALKVSIPELKAPSNADLREKAINQIFDEKWNQICA